MEKQNALNILYQAARMASLTASDHENLAKAAAVLQELVSPQPVEEVQDKNK